MAPVFTSDAVVLGILLLVLAVIFHTSSLPSWKKFYTYVPALLLCYFIPALLYWPMGLIAPAWYNDSILQLASDYSVSIPKGASFDQITTLLLDSGIPKADLSPHQGSSKLYNISFKEDRFKFG